MTTKVKMKKESREWTAETLKEWKTSEAVTWRAQKSTSPDGDVFIGVRQYIKTKSKGEIAGRSGITFKMDENVEDNVRKVRELFEAVSKALLNGTVKALGKKTVAKKVAAKKPASPRRKKDEDSEEESSGQFVLVRPSEKVKGFEYLKKARTTEDKRFKITVTIHADEAQVFTEKRADEVLAKLSTRWKKQEL